MYAVYASANAAPTDARAKDRPDSRNVADHYRYTRMIAVIKIKYTRTMQSNYT